ncbi:MAG: hypothetical protein AAF693_21430 [Bacteroidota bacterium]
MKNILYTLFIIHSVLFAQKPQFEQMAFDYFLNNTLSENYSESGKLYFEGCTESTVSITGLFMDCFESEKMFKELYSQYSSVESDKLPLDSRDKLTTTKHVKKKGLNVEVYRAIVTDSSSYVYLSVYKVNHFVDHYLFEIDSSETVSEYCKQSEII